MTAESPAPEAEPQDRGFFDLRNPWGVRAFLGLCVVSAVVAGLVRKHYDGQAVRRVAELTQAEADARRVHSETLARFPHLDDAGKADALEAGPLPLWSEALRRAEAIQADGIANEAIFDVVASLRGRETATKLLILAFREGDADKLTRAEAAWATAERRAAKVRGGRE